MIAFGRVGGTIRPLRVTIYGDGTITYQGAVPAVPSYSISPGAVLRIQRLASAEGFWTLPSRLTSPGVLPAMATLFISVQAGCSTTTRTVHAQGGPFEGLTALYDTLLAATALGGSAAPGIWPSSPVPGDQVITPADQMTWLLYAVGQRFVLKLGSGFQWTVRLSTSGVIKRVPGIATIRGAQGIYVATAGQTTLTALGVPTCATATQCPTPTQEFTVRVTVRPRI